MRYYIYLDKSILRTLFSIVDDSGFDIEVMEYSFRKTCSDNNQISVRPSLEKISSNDIESNSRDDEENKILAKKRCGDMNKECLGVGFDHGSSSSTQTERRYINIEDISDMKNKGFYHKLIESIKQNSRDSNTRIFEETGYINSYDQNRNIEQNDNNVFFRINNCYVWFNKQNLEGDINIYSKFLCKIHVIGYKVNCMESTDNVIRAIAMYIE